MGKEEAQNKRSNGHICQLNDGRHRKNSQFDDIYDSCARSGVMSLHSEQPISSPRLTSERYNGNGTLPRHGLGLSSHGANISDSDSHLRSLGLITSPATVWITRVLSSSVGTVFLKPHNASVMLTFCCMIKSIPLLLKIGCSFSSSTMMISPGSIPGS